MFDKEGEVLVVELGGKGCIELDLLVRPELPTASAGTSQAPTAAVDNSAPL